MRIKKKFRLDDPEIFKRKALRWAEGFECYHYLDGNNSAYLYDSFPNLLAVSNTPSEKINFENSVSALSVLLAKRDWLFGYFGYEYNDDVKPIFEMGFEMGEWFFPETLLLFLPNSIVQIESNVLPETVLQQIATLQVEKELELEVNVVPVHSKKEYISIVSELKKHLLRGNSYQVNFCTRFVANQVQMNAVQVYEKLNKASPTPFSSLLKLGEKYIVCASPERYLKRLADKVVSQPMKGTAQRGKNAKEDARFIETLQSSAKERAENVMIVDLVRNDLSKVCVPGTVKVEALCEVRTFASVHQMVSTVVGKLEKNVHSEELIKATFPMGSMTGAPKIRAMELIREFENSPRGPFSGALGYFDPTGNFDLNVIIRSLFYNAQTGQLSYSVGSGVTVLSDEEMEYEECLLKAQVISQLLGSS